jgi:DNA-directed RNA polymerase
MDLMERQYERERWMVDQGIDRAVANIERSKARGQVSETPSGVQLMRRTIQPVAEGIVEYTSQQRKTHSITSKAFAGVDPYMMAYFTVREALNGAIKQVSLRATAHAIADHISDELDAADFEQTNPAFYNSVIKGAKERGLERNRWQFALEKANRDKDIIGLEPRWTRLEKVRIGTKLLEILVTKTGLVQIETVRIQKRWQHRMLLGEGLKEWSLNYDAMTALAKPYNLPMLVKPKPWHKSRQEIYHSGAIKPITLITKPRSVAMRALETANLTTVYKSLNILQETPWAINTDVLDVMREAWDRDAGLDCIPRREDEPIPESPPEVVNDEPGGEHRKAWRRVLRKIHERNNQSRSERYEFARCLSIANENRDEAEIFFPHRLDFRGRCYAMSTSLNPQGADYSRSLLRFAEGKPLGAEGAYWWLVHGANVWGYDKAGFDDRAQWAQDHLVRAAACAREPLNDLWWTEADKPWAFLAWCMEAKRYVEQGLETVSYLPIAMDGSCNGLQHFSAMLRDPIGGSSVNLVPQEKPADIYQDIADTVMELLNNVPEDDEFKWVYDSWYVWGIDRKICKRPVMVLPYGGTFQSCMSYVRDAIDERIAAGATDPFGDYMPKASALLARIVWQAMDIRIIGARQVMQWLQEVSRIVTREGKVLAWTTPSGFPIRQAYFNYKRRVVKTKFQGSIMYINENLETDELHGRKQATAVSPNFVHGLDSAALHRTVVRGYGDIQHWAIIHDSYATHACNIGLMHHHIREAFVEMYTEHDVLQEFRDEIASQLSEEARLELPPIPDRGDLDLAQVRNSPYFFS